MYLHVHAYILCVIPGEPEKTCNMIKHVPIICLTEHLSDLEKKFKTLALCSNAFWVIWQYKPCMRTELVGKSMDIERTCCAASESLNGNLQEGHFLIRMHFGNPKALHVVLGIG